MAEVTFTAEEQALVDRLSTRFDRSAFARLPDDDRQAVEDHVSRWIRAALTARLVAEAVHRVVLVQQAPTGTSNYVADTLQDQLELDIVNMGADVHEVRLTLELYGLVPDEWHEGYIDPVAGLVDAALDKLRDREADTLAAMIGS